MELHTGPFYLVVEELTTSGSRNCWPIPWEISPRALAREVITPGSRSSGWESVRVQVNSGIATGVSRFYLPLSETVFGTQGPQLARFRFMLRRRGRGPDADANRPNRRAHLPFCANPSSAVHTGKLPRAAPEQRCQSEARSPSGGDRSRFGHHPSKHGHVSRCWRESCRRRFFERAHTSHLVAQ